MKQKILLAALAGLLAGTTVLSLPSQGLAHPGWHGYGICHSNNGWHRGWTIGRHYGWYKHGNWNPAFGGRYYGNGGTWLDHLFAGGNYYNAPPSFRGNRRFF